MKATDFDLLLLIAKKAQGSSAKITTSDAASSLGISQQSASRRLRALKHAGMIQLNATAKGCHVMLSEQAISLLKERLLELKHFFEKGHAAKELSGNFEKGIGEGKYYVSRKQYMKQFVQLLGFKPFPGTLNLSVDVQQLQQLLFGIEPATIKGFSTRERSFGSIKAFRAKIAGSIEGALIIPKRSAHAPNTIELVSPVNLEKRLRLKQGSKVSFSMQP